MKHIIKRKGHSEEYDSRKLYASIYTSALAQREPVRRAEALSEEVCARAEHWLQNKHEITSNDLRMKAAEFLHDLDKDVGHKYLYHRVVW